MTGSNSEQKVVLGRLGAPHGVKGWIKIQSFTEVPEDLFNYGPLSFLQGKQWRVLDVAEWRPQAKVFVVKLKGCDDRDVAAGFTNCEVGVLQSALPEAADDEVYWHQLEGMQVWSIAAETPVLLGCVDHMMETGANEVLVVVPCEGSIDQQQRLIPYVDHVVQQVDIDKATISVDWDSDF